MFTLTVLKNFGVENVYVDLTMLKSFQAGKFEY